MYRNRLALLFPLALAWGTAVGAIYIHPALWILFGLLLVLIITWQLRGWRS